MADQPTHLDAHRGMAAQKEADLRRLRSEVEADQQALHTRQATLEGLLAAAPAADWPEAADFGHRVASGVRLPWPSDTSKDRLKANTL